MGIKIDHISGVLLAGGKSRRMGQDKRNLLFSGKSLLNHALQVLELVFSEILIVVADLSQVGDEMDHRVVTDLTDSRQRISWRFIYRPHLFVEASSICSGM